MADEWLGQPPDDLDRCRRRLAQFQAADAETGSQLQSAVLLNSVPVEVAGVTYACAAMPSKRVDGDFLDVMQLAPATVDVLFGDVMGKGMQAAILGTVIKVGFLRTLAANLHGQARLPALPDVLAGAESFIIPHITARKSIATLMYLRFRADHMAVEFVDCGHTGLIHYSARRDACYLFKGANMPLGFADTQEYRAFSLPFEPGDTFLLFSDGLSECLNAAEEQFGEDRIMHITRAYHRHGPQALVNTLFRLAFDFSDQGFGDDVSLVCMRFGDHGLPAGADGRPPALQPTPWQATAADCGRIAFRLRPETTSAASRLRVALRKFLEQQGIRDEQHWGPIVLAGHEALENVQKHGLVNGHGMCNVDWRILGGRLTISYSYTGVDYGWSDVPVRELDMDLSHGYGMMIINEVMDNVVLGSGLFGNKLLVLSKDLTMLEVS